MKLPRCPAAFAQRPSADRAQSTRRSMHTVRALDHSPSPFQARVSRYRNALTVAHCLATRNRTPFKYP